MDCPLCSSTGDTIIWQDDCCRVIAVADADYPGFCRVVWNSHVAEMTDLTAEDRARLFSVVMATEEALRVTMRPDKINLASVGNMVPHLHWHVIPRFADDRHFPESVWGKEQRAGTAHAAAPANELSVKIEHIMLASKTA